MADDPPRDRTAAIATAGSGWLRRWHRKLIDYLTTVGPVDDFEQFSFWTRFGNRRKDPAPGENPRHREASD